MLNERLTFGFGQSRDTKGKFLETLYKLPRKTIKQPRDNQEHLRDTLEMNQRLTQRKPRYTRDTQNTFPETNRKSPRDIQVIP